MRPAMVHNSILEERRLQGHDRFDEVWDGVLHMVPFPTPRHQRIVTDLVKALEAVARRRGLVHLVQVGLYPPGTPGHRNYRGPDALIVDRRHISERGVEGHADLVIEVLSPDDESRKKLPFYAAVGVRDVWLIDPARRALEVFACSEGFAVEITQRGDAFVSPALGVDLAIEGEELVIRDGQDTYRIDLAAF